MTTATLPEDVDTTDRYIFTLPLQTPEELELFIWAAWGVRIPKVQVCPGHCSPWEALVSAYFAEHPVEVWKASRGLAGKSFLLAVLGLTEAATMPASVVILGGSGAQSENVHEYTQAFWSHPSAPLHLLRSDPSKRETRLSHVPAATLRRYTHYIRALFASTRQARGPHPQRLRFDEVDEAALRVVDASLGQPMERPAHVDLAGKEWPTVKPQTVLSSTHQYPDGPMTEMLERAVDKGWPVREWCFKETLAPHGWLSEQAVADKRATLTSMMWNVEVELQEPSPEDRAFMPEAVDAMFDPALGSYPGGVDCQHEIEPPEEGATYGIGADWAKENDYTVIIVLRVDVAPMRVVFYLRTNRRPWPQMTGMLDTVLDHYPGQAEHDATGIGNVVDDLLLHQVSGFEFVGRARDEMLADYVKSVENNELRSPDIRSLRQDHKFATRAHLYGSEHLPDNIAAIALARRAAGTALRGAPTGVGHRKSYWTR